MNNTIKKIFAIVTALTLSVMMAPGLAQGATVDELQTQINTLLAALSTLQSQLATLQGGTTTGVPAACTGITFDRNLQLAMTGNDVKCLQALLNTNAVTQVATTGAGSSGNETTYFGNLTRAAVVKFQEKYAADCLTPLGLTAGTGFVGVKTRAKLNSLLTGGVPVTPIPGAAGLTVALAAITPAASTVIAYDGSDSAKQAQVLAPFVTVNFTAGSNGDVKVTNLKFTRTGIAADSNLESTYLYEGNTKLTDGGSISSKVVTFNNASGLFTVPAGTTKSITLKGDLDSAVAAGKTIGFNLAAVADVTSNATVVNGLFPITGNLMTVANATDLGYVTIAGSYAVPSGAQATVSPQDDYTVWSFSLKANQQNLNVERLVFTEVGSINTDDLENFKIYYGGTVIGTVASMDANHQVIFDLSASPISLLKGATKVLTLHADIIKGSTRTFAFTFQYATDLSVKDTNYGVYVGSFITLASGWTLVQPTYDYKIDSGSVSVTKRTDSPTGDVSLDATGVLLAKYDFKTVGEDIKISSLRVAADTTATTGMDNGMVYFNGVQVGSTKDILEYGDGSSDEGTSFTFGSSLIIPAGTTGLVEIKADIKDKDSASFTAGQTARIYLLFDGTYNNAQGVSSLTISDVPGVDTPANTLTVRAGSLTFTKTAAYGNASTTAPTTAMRVGSFQMTAGSTEGINVDSITVAISDSGELEIANLMLMIGSEQIGTTKVTPGTSNTFSVNVALAASQAKTVNVFADILTGATGTIDANGFDITGTATTAITSTAANVTNICYLQVITVATGALAVSYDSGNIPDSLVVALSSGVQMAKYKFASTYEAYTVSEVRVFASSELDVTAPRNAKPNFRDFLNVWLSYKDSTGATVTTSKRSTFVDGMIDFAGLDIYVAANGTSSVTIYADLSAVAATTYALTGDRPQISLAYYKGTSGSMSVYERRVGKIFYAGTGATVDPITWVDDGVVSTAASAEADGTGANALVITPASRLSTAGSQYVTPLSDLNLTVADFLTNGDVIEYYAKTTAANEVPMFTLLLDCPDAATGLVFDGAVDGEIVFTVNRTLTVSGTWQKLSYATETETPTWWSYVSNTCSTTNISSHEAATLATGHLRTTDRIVGATFSVYFGSNSAGTYSMDNLVIKAGTTPVTYNTNALEDDMGDLGTNYVLYKTKPTVTRVGAANETILANGTQDLYRFSVAADNGGDVSLKGIVFNVQSGNAALVLDDFKLYKGNNDYTDYVTIGDTYVPANSFEGDGDFVPDTTAVEVTLVFTDEEIIAAGTSQNFTLKATVAGVAATYSITTYIQQDATPVGAGLVATDVGLGTTYALAIATDAKNDFVWSDRSYGDANHSLLTPDWINGYLVATLGNAISYTVSK